jgi:hypothetical protein
MFSKPLTLEEVVYSQTGATYIALLNSSSLKCAGASR